MATDARPFGDRPITDPRDDRFGLRSFADALAEHIARLPSNDSHVLGLTGAWGSGKTSALSLMVRQLKTIEPSIRTLYFNPWLFRDIEQLVTSFFDEIAAQLKEDKDTKLQKLGEVLAEYGEEFGKTLAFLPIVGGASGVFGKLLKFTGHRINAKRKKETSLRKRREEIERLLEQSDTRLLVVVDDVDRLQSAEVRELMRLIRLVADFPNVNYLLAYDRRRLSAVLSDSDAREDGADGAKYLEKIVQTTFEMPFVFPVDLIKELMSEIELCLKPYRTGPFDASRWTVLVRDVISPMVETPRDVRRIVNALPFAAIVHGEEVAITDVITLEVARLLIPHLFEALAPNFQDLTRVKPNAVPQTDPSPLKVATAGCGRPEAARALLLNLFPASASALGIPQNPTLNLGEWKRDRRVAHPDVMAVYLAKRVPTGAIPVGVIRTALQLLHDPSSLSRHLEALDSAALEKLFQDLALHHAEIPPTSVRSALPVIYRAAYRLREGREFMFDVGSGLYLSTLVRRLIGRIPKEDLGREAAEVLYRLPSLSARVDFLQELETPPADGEAPHIAPERIEGLAVKTYEILIASGGADLKGERELLRAVVWLQGKVIPADTLTEWIREKANDQDVLVALIRSSLTEILSAPMGSADVNKEYGLHWDVLETLVPDHLKRLREIDPAKYPDQRTKIAIATAQKYLNGFRPDRDRRFSSAPPDESKATLLLASGVAKQRAAAFDQLNGILSASTAGMDSARRTFAESTVGSLQRIAKSGQYPAEERAAAIKLLIRCGIAPRLRREFTQMWVNGSDAGDVVSGAIMAMWQTDEAIVDELLDVIESSVFKAEDASRSLPINNLAYAFATIKSIVEAHSDRVSENTIRRALSVMSKVPKGTRIDQILADVTALIGPDVTGPSKV